MKKIYISVPKVSTRVKLGFHSYRYLSFDQNSSDRKVKPTIV